MKGSRFTQAAGIAVLGTVLSLAPASFAQTSGGTGGGTTANNTATGRNDDNRGFDWGWLGLLGLIGLAGLRRHSTHDVHNRNLGTAHA